MKNDKSDKDAATSATSATQEEALTSLLGVPIDPDDPLAFVGLGLGATERAKELVLKGLEFERQEELKSFIESEISRLSADGAALAEKQADLDEFFGARTSGRGRPTKGWLTLDVKQAAAVIDAADLYYQRFGKKMSSQEHAIEFAMALNRALVDQGLRERELFVSGMSAIRNSVSKGLKEFPDDKNRFIEK